MRKLELHAIAEDILEAPALAWSSLAWYWGLSFLGMGPRYMEYMQSGEYEIDKAFFDEDNDQINRIPGYDENFSIKQRFDRAVDFYEYCCIKGKQTSINPPWDFPPDIDTLITFRNRMEARAQPPNEVIKATTDDILSDNADFQKLWDVGNEIKREARAIDYANSIKEAMSYIHGEVAPRMQLTLDQLDKDSGFIESGTVPLTIVSTDQMDEVMPQESQWNKLGDMYIQHLPSGKNVIAEGIIGRYYTAGHNLELAMWNEQQKTELSGIHHATVRTWYQLMEIKESYT